MAKPKIFVSYSMKDMPWVRQFVDALLAADIDAWLDAYRVPPGEPFQAAVEKAFRESDFIVTLVTPETADAPNLFFELGAAMGLGKPIIPIVPKDMSLSLLPQPLRQRQVMVRSTPRETARDLISHLKLQPVHA